MERERLSSMKYHTGIRIDQIPIKGLPGFLFVIATLFTFLVGLPIVRDFLLITGVAGVLGAAGVYYWHNQTRW